MTTEADLIDHYDRALRYYSPLDHIRFEHVLGLLEVPVPSSVLDVGCGVGKLAFQLGPDTGYLGVDYSPARIETAKKLYPSRPFIDADLYQYLETVSGWELAALFEVLEHLERPVEALGLARKAARWVVGSVPKSMPYHAHFDTYDSVAEVQEKLWPDRVVGWRNHFLMVWTPSG